MEKHVLMTLETVKSHVKDKVHYFGQGSHLESKEIGDGNINYVFRVLEPSTGRSVVVKQADKLLRSSGRPLDLTRSRIEVEVLRIQGVLAPSYVPEIYHYDDELCAVTMEDISDYKNLRTEMMAGKIFPNLASRIAEFLVDTLLPSTDLVLARSEKKARVKRFVNPDLCDISEDLVLTEPYHDYKGRNIILDENKEFVSQHLYHNCELKVQVGILRNRFMNEAQALIHGDLHSGSIFVNETGMKVIDPEFAFYGPMGYDVGNVIANLFFAWAYQAYEKGNKSESVHWLKQTITDLVDLFIVRFLEVYEAIVTFELYQGAFKGYYLSEILADSFGYAGTEMIRRVVGDSKVKEITMVSERSQRIDMERALISMGSCLILNRFTYKAGADITNQFETLLLT